MPRHAPFGTKEFKVTLKPGHEWHSDPYQLYENDEVTFSCRASGKFYAGIFDREEYFEDRGAAGGAFDFEFGTDDYGYTERFTVDEDDDYYMVLRVGVFTPSAVEIQVRLKIERE